MTPSDFNYAALRRFPDIEADNLFAHDAADRLLVDHFTAETDKAVLAELTSRRLAVLNDGYGALALPLASVGACVLPIPVYTDLKTSSAALESNANELGLTTSVEVHTSLQTALSGAIAVVMKLPRSLNELSEYVAAIARWAHPSVVVFAAGMVKHMTVRQNEIFARAFAEVSASRAQGKARVITARRLRADAAQSVGEFPLISIHSEVALTVAGYGAAFGAGKLDRGTALLAKEIHRLPSDGIIMDLGCGTGVLTALAAREHPHARVIGTDRSLAAVASAKRTLELNGLDASITWDDAAGQTPSESIDAVLLNPPFHSGAAVHADAGRKLVIAAGRVLKPGGLLLTVFNSHLRYQRLLNTAVGSTQQLARDPKFTVTMSRRSGATS